MAARTTPEISVIVPVRNRVKTVGDAVASVLAQKTKFDFNVIIVDNHSTDGTSELLADFAKKDPRIVHIRPERQDLGIGGCWNEGVHHAKCGRFAIHMRRTARTARTQRRQADNLELPILKALTTLARL